MPFSQALETSSGLSNLLSLMAFGTNLKFKIGVEKMKKYIVTTDLNSDSEQKFVSEHEKIICEIISKSYLIGNTSCISNIFEAGSNFETMVLLSSAMHFSIEIDDVREALWRDEISMVYQQEDEISKAIAAAQEVISLAENQFDRVCIKSNYFKNVRISGFHNLGNVFDEIPESAFEQISRIVRKIYKVKLNLPIL